MFVINIATNHAVDVVQAFFGNMNAHTCQRYAFLQAQDKYKERPNKNPLAGMVFRQVC